MLDISFVQLDGNLEDFEKLPDNMQEENTSNKYLTPFIKAGRFIKDKYKAFILKLEKLENRIEA
jgi:hypothetical protein